MAGTDDRRDLLFGLLAHKYDFVTRSDLLAAMRDRAEPGGPNLREAIAGRASLEDARRTLLEALVEDHLRRHGGDLSRSLAVLDIPGELRRDLETIAGPSGSLANLPKPGTTALDSEATRTYQNVPNNTPGARFRVLRPYARGGLGQVSVALDRELDREVAFKEILDGRADDPRSRAKFEFEAEITGGLEHPGIVPVYSLGRHADGRPYYAMRFVRGDTLKRAIARFHAPDASEQAAGERALALRQLLGRFLDTCDSVAYAHSRGVLHRDIKPENILLGPFGETILADWGLAKIMSDAPTRGDDPGEKPLRPRASGETDETLPGSALGTPAYMSPEQSEGRLDHLGPPSDVYSLGASLYALLTGRPPFSGGDVGEILRQVREGEFPRPRAIRPEVPAALEGICLKAMALQPRDRYASARALADDLEHWLADEPVSAYREPLPARARRWMRRHRTATTAAAAALVVALLGLSAVIAVEARANGRLRLAYQAEREQRERADARFNLAMDAVKEYTSGVSEDVLLKQPELKDLRTKLLRSPQKFYGRLRETLGSGHGDDEANQILLFDAGFALARLTSEIGAPEDALAAYQQALDVIETLAAHHPASVPHAGSVAGILINMASLHVRLGQLDRAEKFYRRGIETLEARPTELSRIDRLNLSNGYTNLGALYQDLGRPTSAEEAYTKGLAIREALAHEDPDDPEVRVTLAGSHGNLAILYRETGRADQAERSCRESIAIEEALIRDHPKVPDYPDSLARSEVLLSLLCEDLGRPAEAEETLLAALKLREALVRDHPTVLDYQDSLAGVHINLITLYCDQGRADAAEASFLAARDLYERLARDHPGVAAYRKGLALAHFNASTIFQETGAIDRALAELDASRSDFEILMRENPGLVEYRGAVAGYHNNAGSVYLSLGQVDRGEASFREAETVMEALARDHPEVPGYAKELASTRYNLGQLYTLTGRPAQAEEAYRAAVAVQTALARDHPENADYRLDLAATYQNLGVLYRQTGRDDRASAAYRRARALLEPLVEADPTAARPRSMLGLVLQVQGNFDMERGRADLAEGAYDRSVEILESLAREHPDVAVYRDYLAGTLMNRAVLHGRAGRRGPAEADLRAAIDLEEGLAREQPDEANYALALATATSNLGQSMLDRRRWEDALALFDRSIEASEAVLRFAPRSPQGRPVLAASLVGRAEAREGLGLGGESRPDLDRAVAMSRGPDRIATSPLLALALARAGRHEEAGAVADALAAASPGVAAVLTECARAHALAAASARDDDALSPPDRVRRAHAHAARAVALLDEARRSGASHDDPGPDDADFAAVRALLVASALDQSFPRDPFAH